MPRYRYRCPNGCDPALIGGRVLDARDVERSLTVDERDLQVCRGCHQRLERIWDTKGLQLHWPYHMSQNVSEDLIAPSSQEARERWDEYVE